jgi:chemotaxis signal transduction protein
MTILIGHSNGDDMPPASTQSDTLLLVAVGAVRCGIPASAVVETMRPQPVEPLGGNHGAIIGVAAIRGVATPVIDLRILISGTQSSTPPERFVTIRIGDGQAALAVDRVEGLRNVDASSFDALPPLVKHADDAALNAITAADARLTVILDASRVVPDDVWQFMATAGRTT